MEKVANSERNGGFQAMWLVNSFFLAAIAFSLSQTPNSSESPSQKPEPAAATQSHAATLKPEDSSSTVSDLQAVITIPGICDDTVRQSGQPSGTCRTVITRKEFEALMNALNPGGQPISPLGRQNLAQAYVEALAFVDRKSVV